MILDFLYWMLWYSYGIYFSVDFCNKDRYLRFLWIDRWNVFFGWCYFVGGIFLGSYDLVFLCCFEGDSIFFLMDCKNSLLMKFGGFVIFLLFDLSGRFKFMFERCVNVLKKRIFFLSDRKINFDFFWKLEGVRNLVDW